MDGKCETLDNFEPTETDKPLAIAVKTTALVMAALIILSTIINIPLYFIAASLPISPCGFLDVWPLSYLFANSVALLALVKYASGFLWYLVL